MPCARCSEVPIFVHLDRNRIRRRRRDRDSVREGPRDKHIRRQTMGVRKACTQTDNGGQTDNGSQKSMYTDRQRGGECDRDRRSRERITDTRHMAQTQWGGIHRISGFHSTETVNLDEFKKDMFDVGDTIIKLGHGVSPNLDPCPGSGLCKLRQNH